MDKSKANNITIEEQQFGYVFAFENKLVTKEDDNKSEKLVF